MLSVLYHADGRFLALHAGLQLTLAAGFFIAARRWPAAAKLVYAPLLLALVALAALHADNVGSYGPLMRDTIDALFQTTAGEAISYLRTYASSLLAPVIAGSCLLVLASLAFIRRGEWRPLTALGLAVLGLALVYTGRAEPVMIYRTAKDYGQKMADFNRNRPAALGGLDAIQAKTDANVVVVLGESTARRHLGVYGYPRQTTPRLEALLPELTLYTDAITTHSHTNESLSRALVFNERGRHESFTLLPDLLSVARIAGLDTYWLSNQNTIGIWDNAVSVLSAQAGTVKFHDPGSGFKRERDVFDEALVESLGEVLENHQGGGKLVFVHLMAAHFPYCEVIPPGFQVASLAPEPADNEAYYGNWVPYLASGNPPQVLEEFWGSVACYDQAIAYQDQVVAQLIERLRSDSAPAVLLFAADHGEAPELGNGHDSRRHSHLHVEVPFVLWRSPGFPRTLVLEPDRRVSLEDLSYAVADLAGIEHLPGLEERSVFSPGYAIPARATLDGSVGYDYWSASGDPVEKARGNLFSLPASLRERTWAHRLNSGASLQEASGFFSGVEMDLVFENDRFLVNHPPAPDVGLTLETQLRLDRPGLNYWFDWKNASADNRAAALARLNELDARHGLRQRSLVEISDTSGTATAFTKAGWSVSYYLPTELIAACQARCDETARRDLATNLWLAFDQGGFSAISFDSGLMPFVEGNLLERIQRDSVPAYTWSPAIDISSQDAPGELEALLGREWLGATLVTLPSRFRR